MSQSASQTQRSLYRKFSRAVRDFQMIRAGDRVMVAISGGKDSHVLLYFLDILRRRAPIPFEVIAVHLDQVQPGYDGRALENYLQNAGYSYRILQRDTYAIVKEKTLPGQGYCFMCSRLRRGILYNAAVELGCTKIALGHHRDDALETLLMNMIFSGQLKSMPPVLESDDRRNVVIRPLIYCGADELQQLATERQFPILPCNLCGSQPDMQRMAMRRLLDEIERNNPGAKNRMLAAMRHVRPTHLLDRELWKRVGELSAFLVPAEETEGEGGERDQDGDRGMLPQPLMIRDRSEIEELFV